MGITKNRIHIQLNLTLFYLFKFVKQPVNLIFSFVFPIIWVIISYYLYGRNLISIGTSTVSVFVLFFSGTLLISSVSTALINIPVTISLDRISNRIKFFRTMNITKTDYLLANTAANFVMFFLVFNISILIANFAFSMFLPASLFFSIYFILIFSYLLLSTWGIFISRFGKSDRTANLIYIIVFYPVLFLSGVTIPSYTFDQGSNWFKYIQMLTPAGAATYISSNLSIANYIANSETIQLFDWNVDWLQIIVPIAEAIILGYLSIKLFKWK